MRTRPVPVSSTIRLAAGQRLAREESKIDQVYFPLSGIVSILVALDDGRNLEVGSIGKDGAFGIGQALDHRKQVNAAVVTIGGEAVVMRAADLDHVAANDITIRKATLAYDQFHVVHLQQNVACNAAHAIPQRFAKMLLRAEQLVGSTIDLTQDQISRLMGARRTSITQAANSLREAGIITYSRGRIQIKDSEALSRQSCECHAKMLLQYERLVTNHIV